MKWNYRIVSFPDGEEGRYHKVCEVFYDADGEVLNGYGDDCVPQGPSVEDARRDWEFIGQAFGRPVLRVEDIEAGGEL